MIFTTRAMILGLALIVLFGCAAGAGPAHEQALAASDPASASVRMTVEEVLERRDSGENIVFLDSRNHMVWESAEYKIPGAIRVGDQAQLEQVVPELPSDSLIITYCT